MPDHDQVRNRPCRLTLHLAAPQIAHRDLGGEFEPLGVQLMAKKLVLEQVKCSFQLLIFQPTFFPVSPSVPVSAVCSVPGML